MEKFFAVLVTWMLGMFLFAIMFLHYFLDSSQILRTFLIITFAIGIAMSTITYLFDKQSKRIDMLEKRIIDLEVNK